MFTYEFDYIPSKTGEKVVAKIEQDDEVMNVTIGDRYLGTMVEDSHSPSGFHTDDPALTEELDDFAMAYREALAIDNLPTALHEIYGQNLIGWAWTEDKDLKIIAHAETDLSEFADVMSIRINEISNFDKPLKVILSKEGSGETREIFVN